MTLETEFYNQIEKPIREIVRVLRDNGINTTCSCGHELYVEADIIPNGTLQTIHNTLFNYLAENSLPIKYTIDIHLEQESPLTRCFAVIWIGSPSNNKYELLEASKRQRGH